MLTLEHPPFLTDLLTDSQLAEVISRFYAAVYADPMLSPLFAGVERSRQEQRLAGFIRMTRGRSNPFDGDFLRSAHARLNLTPALFARRAQLMAAAIEACGHGAEVIACWRRYDALWWRYIRGQ
ncbi:MAG: truncated hemoglobin YjbI [Myxococcota bacterium]|jgi:truncated hemoglobin YjbI